MFRKLNIKTLGLVFIGLLSLTILIKVIDNTKGVNTLKAVLFDVDEQRITSVIVKPRMFQGQHIESKKQDDGWKILANGKSYNGDANFIEGLIAQVNGLKPLRLAAQGKDSWEKFELTDSLSTVVKLMGSTGELAQLYIGKFSYQQARQNPMMQQNPYMQQRGTMTTYVRSGDDEEVYAVEGFLASSANRDVNAFRDKTILTTSKTGIHKIAFAYPADSSFTMIKNEGVWMVDGMALDSAAVDAYLSDITTLSGSTFSEDAPTSHSHQVKIHLEHGASIEVKAKLEDEQTYISSSQNLGSVFMENLDENFEKLFISKNKLIK
ncbi:protein of unknown function [Saccharicrinis carchari]|uniref:DUF4340 domain-containing protein n=1 Tax=Saccharicrinis carchari TaxID=1168039 RepID=A0A521E8H0_SACCC|nr:DUF4340 domain-containing protein [Saccharicrinis carchari]SMO80072.1 protein of unknown function [Saccharicrinis carchari]